MSVYPAYNAKARRLWLFVGNRRFPLPYWLLHLVADCYNATLYSRTWWPYRGEPQRKFGENSWAPWREGAV